MSSSNYSTSEFSSANLTDQSQYLRNSGPSMQLSVPHPRQQPYGHSSSQNYSSSAGQPLPSPSVLFGAPPPSFQSTAGPGYPQAQGYPSSSSFSAQPYPSSRSSYQHYQQYPSHPPPPSALQPLSTGRSADFSRTQYPSPDSPNGKAVCVLPLPVTLASISGLPSNEQGRGELSGFLPSFGKSQFTSLPPFGMPPQPTQHVNEILSSDTQTSHHLLYSQYDYKSIQQSSARPAAEEPAINGAKRERDSHSQTSTSASADQVKAHHRKKSRGSFSSHVPPHVKRTASPPLSFCYSPPETPPASSHCGTSDTHKSRKCSLASSSSSMVDISRSDSTTTIASFGHPSVATTFVGLSSPPTTPQVDPYLHRRSPDSPLSPSSESCPRDGIHKCADCGRVFALSDDLYEHKWEHSQSWKEVEKMVDLNKHQQVQIMEAAQILIEMASMRVNVMN